MTVSEMITLGRMILMDDEKVENRGKKSSTGVRGVVMTSRGNYRAQIMYDGKPKSIGIFKTLDEASVALAKAKLRKQNDLLNNEPYMSHDEIKTRYKWSENKLDSVEILADLNDCSKEKIRHILWGDRKHGY